jgi:hypothetical protein
VADTVRLLGPTQRDHAHRLIDAAPVGFVMKLGEETRRDAQNRKLWPMIKDIREQVPGMAAFAPDDIKLRFLNSLGVEMRWLPELDGAGVFPVGLKSSALTVAQFSLLVELLYKYGAEHGVRWSEP